MPSPASYSLGLSDLDSESTKRNESGYMQRDRIRGGIRKYPFKWRCLSDSDASTLLSAVSGENFTVSVKEPSGMVTKTVYAGDKTVDAVNTVAGIRWDVSFDMVEC